MFSYLSPEARVRKDHPLRAIRAMVDEVLSSISRRFDTMYANVGRPSIAPEKLLRAQLLQMLYSIRSERLLMEEMDYNLLFRWFVGLNADDAVWDATVFTKNRDRLLEADVAKEFLARVVEQARAQGSDFATSISRWTARCWKPGRARRVFSRRTRKAAPPPDDPGNPTVNFRGEKRSNDTHESKTDPDALAGAQRRGQGVEVELLREPAGGESQRTDRGRGSVSGQRNGGARRGAGDAGEGSAERQRVTVGGDKGFDTCGFVRRVPASAGDAARGAEPGTTRRQRD